MARPSGIVGLGVAAIAASFLALFIGGIGYGCQTDGGGTNCDVIVGVAIAVGALSVVFFGWMFIAIWRMLRGRRSTRPR